MTENEIGRAVVDPAVAVQREPGPGLLETVGEVVPAHELESRGARCARQVPVRMSHRDVSFEEAFRVDGLVIPGPEPEKELASAHRRQLQTDLRLTGLKLGFLLNFRAALMKDGIVRAVNGLPES